MPRKLRTVTSDEILNLRFAMEDAALLVVELKGGGASKRLIDAARALRKRVEGAHRHALRAKGGR